MIQFAQKRIAYFNVLKGIEKLFELKEEERVGNEGEEVEKGLVPWEGFKKLSESNPKVVNHVLMYNNTGWNWNIKANMEAENVHIISH